MNPKEKPHRALITDGAGYIGAHITHLLKKTDCPMIFFNKTNTGNTCTTSDAPYPHLLLASHAFKKQPISNRYSWGNTSIRKAFT